MKGSEILEKILRGTRRFVQGERTGVCDPVDIDLGAMIQTQSLVAAVLCCSDSRVPPEHMLDKKIGEIFVIRVPAKFPSCSFRGARVVVL